MILFGATRQAALEKESSAYCLRNWKQLPWVWGDSNACTMHSDHYESDIQINQFNIEKCWYTFKLRIMDQRIYAHISSN